MRLLPALDLAAQMRACPNSEKPQRVMVAVILERMAGRGARARLGGKALDALADAEEGRARLVRGQDRQHLRGHLRVRAIIDRDGDRLRGLLRSAAGASSSSPGWYCAA